MWHAGAKGRTPSRVRAVDARTRLGVYQSTPLLIDEFPAKWFMNWPGKVIDKLAGKSPGLARGATLSWRLSSRIRPSSSSARDSSRSCRRRAPGRPAGSATQRRGQGLGVSLKRVENGRLSGSAGWRGCALPEYIGKGRWERAERGCIAAGHGCKALTRVLFSCAAAR